MRKVSTNRHEWSANEVLVLNECIEKAPSLRSGCKIAAVKLQRSANSCISRYKYSLLNNPLAYRKSITSYTHPRSLARLGKPRPSYKISKSIPAVYRKKQIPALDNSLNLDKKYSLREFLKLIIND